MTASTKKSIAIVGATGLQGSSVAQTFLRLDKWHVRCLTRNPASETAKALQDQGAELVQGDLGDPVLLSQFFKGVHAIFLNTELWSVWRPLHAAGIDADTASQKALGHELKHGKNAADAAAKIPTLERLVYSGLFPIKEASGGKYVRCAHPEAKAKIYQYILNQQPVLAKKTSLIVLGSYHDNSFLTPRRDLRTGHYIFALPMKGSTVMPIVDAKEATGPLVRALIEDEEPETKLLAYNSQLTIDELAQVWSNASGRQAQVAEVSIDVIHQQSGAAYEQLEAAAFVGEFGYTAGLDGIIEPQKLKSPVKLKSFEEYLKAKDWRRTFEELEKMSSK